MGGIDGLEEDQPPKKKKSEQLRTMEAFTEPRQEFRFTSIPRRKVIPGVRGEALTNANFDKSDIL